MKRKSIIISLFLAFVFLFASFTGCKDTKTGGSSGDDGAYKGKGVHEATVQPTAMMMVSNRSSDYKILLPAEPTLYEGLAGDLINEYFEKSMGITLPIEYSSESTTSVGKYISVGDTALMRKSGISVSVDKYGESGFKIVTIGDDVYLSGARTSLRDGTYYAAQEFLKYTIGWRAYALDEVKYDKMSDLKFYNFNVTEIPEFDERSIGAKQLGDSDTYNRYLRLTVKPERRLNYSGHSHLEVLRPKNYVDKEGWFVFESGVDHFHEQALLKGQLCLGKEEVREAFAAQLVKDFNERPNTNFVHLGQQDTQKVMCECDKCMELMEGTNYAGLLVMFTNDIARRVTAEIQKTQPDRQLIFQTFAYQKSLKPPVHEENGVIVPDKPEVIPDDNVIIQFAPDGGHSTTALDDPNSSVNRMIYNYLKGWQVLTDNISNWLYTVKFSWNIISTKSWDIAKHNMLLFSEMGVTSYYHQTQIHRHQVQMTEMRFFVESQLMWNVSLDYNDLAYEFIDNYYGPAAPAVKNMFDSMTAYYQYLFNEYGFGGGYYSEGLNDSTKWTFEYVESIRQIMMKGFEALESIEDPVEYQKYYWRLSYAYLENLYMQLEYYRAEYGREYTLQNADYFEQIINRYGISLMDEGSDYLSTYIRKWRGTYGE